MTIDYRESHLQPEKGKSYQASFSNISYRSMVWQFEKGILDNILEKFYRNSEINYLDFACGTGRILVHLEERTKTSFGIDLSPSMLEMARRNSKRSKIIEADVTKEDVLQDHKFNLITAFRFFPNAQPELRNQAMQLLHSHLADNGYLIFNNHINKGSIVNRLARFLKRSGPQGMSITEVKTLLEKSHLDIVEIYHLCVVPASEKHRLLPLFLLQPIEKFLSKCRLFRNLGGNLIFLCRKSVKNVDEKV